MTEGSKRQKDKEKRERNRETQRDKERQNQMKRQAGEQAGSREKSPERQKCSEILERNKKKTFVLTSLSNNYLLKRLIIFLWEVGGVHAP